MYKYVDSAKNANTFVDHHIDEVIEGPNEYCSVLQVSIYSIVSRTSFLSRELILLA